MKLRFTRWILSFNAMNNVMNHMNKELNYKLIKSIDLETLIFFYHKAKKFFINTTHIMKYRITKVISFSKSQLKKSQKFSFFGI